MSGLAKSSEGTHEQIAALAGQVGNLQRQIAALSNRRSGSTVDPAGQERGAGRDVPYRYDPAPRWMDESGWLDQSAEHRKVYPALRMILEKERWPGAPVRITYPKLAALIGASDDTAKRRLRALANMGVIKLHTGSGSVPTTVYVQHPVATPIPFSEVPYPAGGLAGAPDGYLAGLTGAKRAYAELYGADLPEPEPVPDQEGVPPVEDEAAYQPDNPAPPIEGHGAGRGDAGCPPSETGDLRIMRSLVVSDAREPKPVNEDRKHQTEPTPAQRMEREAAKIPGREVSEEAVEDAGAICEALGRKDEVTAHRAAQVAELLRRRDRSVLLPEVLGRVRRTVGGGNRIHRPGVYLCATVLDVARTHTLDPPSRELAAKVLASEPRQDNRGEARRRNMQDIKRGYEWLFD